MAQLERDLKRCDPAKVGELEAQVKKLKVELASYESEIGRLRKDNGRMDQRIKEFEAHMLVHSKMENELKENQTELADAKKTISELQEKLQSESRVFGVMKGLCHSFQASVNRYDHHLTPHMEKCPELGEQIRASFLRDDSEFIVDIYTWFKETMDAQNEPDPVEMLDEDAEDGADDEAADARDEVVTDGIQRTEDGSVVDPKEKEAASNP